jgi:hypothetical protein
MPAVGIFNLQVTSRVSYISLLWGIFTYHSRLVYSKSSLDARCVHAQLHGSILNVALILLIISSECYAQTHDVFLKSGENSIGNAIVQEEASQKESALQKRYIVRLQNAAVSTTATSGRQRTIQVVLSQHQKFQEDFSEILNKNAAARTSGSAEILNEYVNVFNGFAIRADQSTIEALKALDYVSEVFEDQVMYAHDLESSKLISADKVWEELGVTGKNISIAIIDTGIDYNHQDLGGGFGDNFKVKGGYDFVNNDNDPVDDNGHGTHVAGIAAGNGPGLKGVAPDANLYAYKVLNSAGSGYDSWILAAIERVVDPDQDPSTDDKHDVANMSLGRPIGDSDPVSEAVNNAVRNGVTFVVSGGNRSDYGTIGTPAVSADAITVAATDKYDSTAYFSSKGPTENNYFIKPDVGAPGVKIYSSVIGNSYANYSGTSMATPHVTGAVALLLEKNPSWTPDIVKSALMGTAVNTNGEMIWHQGAGRVDVRKAIESKFSTSPQSISLGISDLSNANWIRAVMLKLKNTSDQPLTFHLNAEGEAVAKDIGISITPSSVTIAAHTETNVNIGFNISVNSLPFKSYPEAYSGVINVISDQGSLKVPYAFLHTLSMNLSFTGEYPQWVYIVSTTQRKFWKKFDNPQRIIAMLPDDHYDVIAFYTGNYYVIKENLLPTESALLTKSDAKNLITFNRKDKNGNLFPPGDSKTAGATIISGLNTDLILYYKYPLNTFYFSDNTRYSIDTKYITKSYADESAYYDITLSSGLGANDNLAFSNDPTDFTEIVYQAPDAAVNSDQLLTYYLRLDGGLMLKNDEPLTVKNPMRIRYAQNKSNAKIIGEILRFCPPAGKNGYCWETQLISVSKNGISFADFLGVKFKTLEQTDSLRLNFNSTLPYLNAHMNNTKARIQFTDAYKFGIFNRQYGERENGKIQYKLIRNDADMGGGDLRNRMIDDGFDKPNFEIEAAPANYVLQLQYNDFKTEYFAGKIKASLTFSTDQADKNPPSMTSFMLETLGKSTSRIETGNPATIKFTLRDCDNYNCTELNALLNVSLQTRNSDSTTWTPIPVNVFNRTDHTASIPAGLADGFYDVRLVASDMDNNILDYELSPAFVVGDPSKIIRLITPLRSSLTTRRPQFKWSKLDGETLYEISIASDKNFSNQKTYKVSDTTFILPVLLEKSTVYFWHVQANEGSTKRLSQTFEFTTGNEDWSSITLLSPSNNTVSQPLTRFTWSAGDTTAYHIQISTDPDFKTFVFDSIVSSTETVLPLSPFKKYFWHVQSAGKFALWSETWNINILAPAFGLLEPANHATEIDLDCTLRWSDANGAARYKFYISRDSLFTSELYTRFVDDTVMYMDVDPNSGYFWKISAMYADTVIYSETFAFRTTPNQVTLLAPANNAAEQSLSTDFSWTRAITNGYTIEVAEDTAFLATFAALKLNDSTQLISGLSPGRRYFWRVKPTRDNSSWSLVNSFTTTTPRLFLTAPTNHTEDVQENADLRWEPVDGVNNYTLLFALADGSSKNVIHNGISENHFLIGDLPPGQFYAWKIGANFGDTTIWSEEFTFKTATRYGFETNEFQAYPNPSTGSVKFKINFFEKGNAALYVTNPSGLIIYSSELGQIQGEKIVSWDGFDNLGKPISNGIYIAFVKIGSASKPIKLVISK